ncbi:MAG TPA: MGMT family protein [Candidatus Magasanikbacteria bacterium]|nr:MGMT family protein [Candidatus Magasanikbacteria bacterium]
MRNSTSFELKVYEALKCIPKGKVTTYGQIAKFLGKPRASRAVGNALNRNPHAPQVPCHRVVTSIGIIGGYAFGPKKKIEILKKEGVTVAANKVDLKKFGYDFS